MIPQQCSTFRLWRQRFRLGSPHKSSSSTICLKNQFSTNTFPTTVPVFSLVDNQRRLRWSSKEVYIRCKNVSTQYPYREINTLNIHSGLAKPVSEAQRRQAQLELDRMELSTSRLLNLTINSSSSKSEPKPGDNVTNISDAVVNEARVALHYWSRRWYMHFHPGFGRAAKGSSLTFQALQKSPLNSVASSVNDESIVDETEFSSSEDSAFAKQKVTGDHGARQAERLLDWSISNTLVPHGIFDHSPDISDVISPNYTCVNIIETYLLPCAYGGIIGGIRQTDDNSTELMSYGNGQYATLTKHFAINASYNRAIVDATRVMMKMKNLQAQFPEYISSDSLSIKAELNVWSKRAYLLGRDDGVRGSGGVLISERNQNGTSVNMLRSLELEDANLNATTPFDDTFYTVSGCLEKMEEILSKAEDQYVQNMFGPNNELFKPHVDWYNHILGALIRSNTEGALTKAKMIFRGMEEFQNNSSDENSRCNNTDDIRPCWSGPDTVSYNTILFGLSQDAGLVQGKEAGELLQKMKDNYGRSNNFNIRPDDVTYGVGLNAMAQAGMAREAENILESLEEEYNDFLERSQGSDLTTIEADNIITPNNTMYNSVLNAFARSADPNSAKKAEALFSRMRTLSSTGKNPAAEPDIVSLSTVISCHSRSGTREGAERAEELLETAINLYSKGNAKMKPDIIVFNNVLSGWANISGSSDNGNEASNDAIPAERAEKLLKRITSLKDDRSLDINPIVQTYNIVLDCWAKSRRKGAAERALNILRVMPSVGISPDDCSYNSVLDAIASEMSLDVDPSWVDRAEELFEEMKKLRRAGELTIKNITFHIIMNLYAKSSRIDGAQKAEALLRRMDRDGVCVIDMTYNICIDACARRAFHRGYSKKAEYFLEEMISLSEKGNVNCSPKNHSFASVINALAKSGESDSLERAEKVMEKAEQMISPNSILYNSYLDCIVKNGGNGLTHKVESVLRKMISMRQSGRYDAQPTVFTYSIVLSCFARDNEKDAAERAEGILLEMERLHELGLSEVATDTRHYSSVITAWAKSGSPTAVERSLMLLDRMEQNYRNGNLHAKPNSYCYNACIHAVAKSPNAGKAKQCKEILQRMIAARGLGFHDAAPSRVTYSTIINACAFDYGGDYDRKVAFDLAKSCFQALLESNELTDSAFLNFFHNIVRHLKHGPVRDQLAESVFHEGCKRGFIGKRVLKSFKKASPGAFDRLLPSGEKSIPKEWSQNVVAREKL